MGAAIGWRLFVILGMMTHNFERITEEGIDHIYYARCHYYLRPFSNEEQRKLHSDNLPVKRSTDIRWEF